MRRVTLRLVDFGCRDLLKEGVQACLTCAAVNRDRGEGALPDGGWRPGLPRPIAGPAGLLHAPGRPAVPAFQALSDASATVGAGELPCWPPRFR
jgi:hypothetical protein